MGANVKQRLIEFIGTLGYGQAKFERLCGLANGYVNNIRLSITPDKLQKIARQYPDLNTGWLLTGEGEMLKSTPQRIPVYDAATIGGVNELAADVNHPVAEITETIYAGEWFPNATHAIYHYGSSMTEYPSGCILVLHRLNDPRLIINGRNYVIETEDYRLTKQLQDDGDSFIAYSTNTQTYPDGRLIHAPIRIPKSSIRHIDLVIGCVQKEYPNGAIPIRQQ